MSARSESGSSSATSDVSDEGEWLDVENDEESITIVSLFDSQTFSSWNEMLDSCKKHHDFDFIATIKNLQLDFHGAVKLVNYIRSRVRDQQPVAKNLTLADFEDDGYFKPVLENDALIVSLDEILDSDLVKADTTASQLDSSQGELLAQKQALEAELESVRTQFSNYRLAVQETLDRRWGDDTEQSPAKGAAKGDRGNYYFESYAYNDIHETMLKDTVRTDAYRDFIYNNKHIFKGKVVLDIGCGSGILSMFCAKAGAARVIAVDNSDIIKKATENIFNNGLSDIITCVKGAIEEVKLPVDEVDIIPDGLLVPSSGTIWMAPIQDTEYMSEHISYWRDVYGFDMKAMQEGIYDDVRVEAMPQNTLCGEPYPFKVLDLHTIKPEELSFTARWESEPVPEPMTTPEVFVKAKNGNVAFTTGPSGIVTHWKQGLLLVPPENSPSKLELPEIISGQITFAALEENARALRIDVTCSSESKEGKKWSWKLE
ncbi:ribosomal protein l11 methyltransferase (PrmA) domain-containing protein [Trichoderma breve]|uniref:type I protein arginine methyltransferase n=1 Tax=Trichoderma breve TaxID=2034170 RepID=A0A9W9BCU1_9HYPO|nr:ribosomal protein l11 methyltransferase (PrmA) domain-containing protein [Trichoderma breve]KAJ4860132.1 ribosomal protein l11 methyltransferase (PrmA) domain-containing protein [Trichoderma breve]